MFPRSSCLVAAGALAATVAGQTIPTTPVTAVNTEGIGQSLAVARNGYQLTQTIYESAHVYRPLQRWSTLYLRPDNRATSGTFPAFQRQLTLRLSSAGVPSPELASQTSFRANHGTDLTTVLDNKTVSFPAHVPGGGGPAAFSVRIPLDRAFPFAPRLAHLLLEIETAQEPSGPTSWSWYPDAVVWFGSDWTVFTSTFGSACSPTPQGYSASASNNQLTTSLRWARILGNQPRHPGVAWIGTSKTNWGPLPLPFPLTLLGAPGCAVRTDPLTTFVGMTGGGSGESFTVRVPIPRTYALLGQRIYSQTMVFDEVGLRVSEGAEFFFSSPPSPYQAMTLRRFGTPGDTPQAVSPDRAIVIGVQ